MKEKKESKSDKTSEKESKYVQSLERALSILELMAAEGNPISVSELSVKTGLKISTVHRMLATLMHRGYVEQEADNNKYRLGFKLLEIGNAALCYSDIRAVARPYLEKLVDKCNETANLAVLDGSNVVYIDQVESKKLIIVKMFAQVGNRGPVHCTASGKVLLSQMSPGRMDEIVNNIDMVKYTNETIVERTHLLKELARVKREGYALDWGEMEEHVRCIAAPVFNHEGRAIASVSISGPSNRITGFHLKNELVELVKETAAEISRSMGCKGR